MNVDLFAALHLHVTFANACLVSGIDAGSGEEGLCAKIVAATAAVFEVQDVRLTGTQHDASGRKPEVGEIDINPVAALPVRNLSGGRSQHRTGRDHHQRAKHRDLLDGHCARGSECRVKFAWFNAVADLYEGSPVRANIPRQQQDRLLIEGMQIGGTAKWRLKHPDRPSAAADTLRRIIC